MNLKQLFSGIVIQHTIGNTNTNITTVVFDSRKVQKDCLFVALSGTQVDGHQFIEQAIQKGAIAVACKILPDERELFKGIIFLQVEDTASALGLIARNFYDSPSSKLNLVGITGTNGKTTSVTLLYNLFTNLGYKVGLLSTVHNKIGDRTILATHTTPDALTINSLLQEMVAEGCEYVFMEVSSHAIHQNRIKGLHFRGGIFTNLSHDHLDYHKTFKSYIYAKKKFFDDLPKSAFALTNIDDKQGRVMVQNTKAHIATYSLKKLADYKAKILENRMEGLHLTINNQELFCRLVGVFNAYNLLAAYAAGHLLEAEPQNLLRLLSNLKAAEGRFDTIIQSGKIGIVDYAHTPDALENVLDTIKKVAKKSQKIITVVGCGGDRDKTKRPIMAKVACNKSDMVILTSDNPRTEEPYSILKEMEKGVPEIAEHKVLVIEDRTQAIKTACKLANKEDIILVAGKGHEKYQEINGKKFPFDDKQTLINKLR